MSIRSLEVDVLIRVMMQDRSALCFWIIHEKSGWTEHGWRPMEIAG